jgi:hypothetical protein
MDKRGNMADDTLVLELGYDYCLSLCKCLASFPLGWFCHILQLDRKSNPLELQQARRGTAGTNRRTGQKMPTRPAQLPAPGKRDKSPVFRWPLNPPG